MVEAGRGGLVVIGTGFFTLLVFAGTFALFEVDAGTAGFVDEDTADEGTAVEEIAVVVLGFFALTALAMSSEVARPAIERLAFMMARLFAAASRTAPRDSRRSMEPSTTFTRLERCTPEKKKDAESELLTSYGLFHSHDVYLPTCGAAGSATANVESASNPSVARQVLMDGMDEQATKGGGGLRRRAASENRMKYSASMFCGCYGEQSTDRRRHGEVARH